MTIALGAQINEKDAKNQTPLMKASAGGHGAIVQMLLGKPDALLEIQAFRNKLSFKAPDFGKVTDKLKGAKDAPGFKDFKDLPEFKDLPDIGKLLDLAAPLKLPQVEINAQDSEGRSALMYAAQGGHVDVIQALTQANAVRELVDREGNTAWMLAAEAGHEQAMVASLVQAPQKDYLNRKNKAGKTAYELAAMNGHADVVAYFERSLGDLVKVKIVPKKIEPIGRAGDSPLFKAVMAGEVETVQDLLNRGTPIDGRDDKGQTVLMLAAGKGDIRTTLLLVNHSGKVHPDLLDARDAEGRTAIVHAVLSGNGDTVDAILIALSGAWERGKLNWFRTLDHPDKTGKNALELAQAKGFKPIALKLDEYYRAKLDLDNGAMNGYMTALSHAADIGDFATIQAIMRHKPSVTEGYNIWALMNAAKKGHILAAKAILDGIPDAEGRLKWLNCQRPANVVLPYNTPIDYATKGQFPELAAYLTQEKQRAEKEVPTVPMPKVEIPVESKTNRDSSGAGQGAGGQRSDRLTGILRRWRQVRRYGRQGAVADFACRRQGTGQDPAHPDRETPADRKRRQGKKGGRDTL